MHSNITYWSRRKKCKTQKNSDLKMNTKQPFKSQLWIKCNDLIKFSAQIHKNTKIFIVITYGWYSYRLFYIYIFVFLGANTAIQEYFNILHWNVINQGVLLEAISFSDSHKIFHMDSEEKIAGQK